MLDGFLTAIGEGSGVELVMSTQWRQAGWVRVEREAPYSTAAGKVLHLHRVGSAPRVAAESAGAVVN